ncbi:MAG TPA: tRNA (guanosine(37)-N1)-methyltransferase TrmD [Nitriliruptorales bacterium]|nr:tRNA (guanosine(37)-N1)-methyltransferase TrmD [Nitriliruptorales bacterium]
MRIDVLTIFPGFFDGPFRTSLLHRAVETGVVDLRVHDLRSWAADRHRTVDDSPYGGGPGMVMSADVWFAAAEDVWGGDAPSGVGGPRPRTVLLTPRGVPLTQPLVAELAREPRLVLCCGRYEGIDERVHRAVATDEMSVGDYVLAGGEAAAVVLVEAVTRLVPGVVGNEASTADESFSLGLLEHPQYTRPAELRGLGVPEVLLSGDHAAVARWRRERALDLTRRRRPDLYYRAWRDRRGGRGRGAPSAS